MPNDIEGMHPNKSAVLTQDGSHRDRGADVHGGNLKIAVPFDTRPLTIETAGWTITIDSTGCEEVA